MATAEVKVEEIRKFLREDLETCCLEEAKEMVDLLKYYCWYLIGLIEDIKHA